MALCFRVYETSPEEVCSLLLAFKMIYEKRALTTRPQTDETSPHVPRADGDLPWAQSLSW